MTERLVLPSRLDLASLGEVFEALRGVRGRDVELDASQTDRIGGQGAQLLASALRTWSDDGRRLAIVNPSECLTAGLRRLGFGDILPFEQERPA